MRLGVSSKCLSEKISKSLRKNQNRGRESTAAYAISRNQKKVFFTHVKKNVWLPSRSQKSHDRLPPNNLSISRFFTRKFPRRKLSALSSCSINEIALSRLRHIHARIVTSARGVSFSGCFPISLSTLVFLDMKVLSKMNPRTWRTYVHLRRDGSSQ